MTRNFFKEFSEYEDTLLKKYEQDDLFINIKKLSDAEFIHALTQYGEGISANFVKFLETVLRLVRNEKAQEAIIRILRDEIPAQGPTHQLMRSRACERIGILPEQLASTELTEETKAVVGKYFDIVTNPMWAWSNRDLALTTFVRVAGESLVSVVYKTFTQEIIRRCNVSESDIEFYSFHWHHDEKGGTPFEGGEIGHTEYYDIAMEDLMRTEADLIEAKAVGDLALQIRCDFQKQFVKHLSK